MHVYAASFLHAMALNVIYNATTELFPNNLTFSAVVIRKIHLLISSHLSKMSVCDISPLLETSRERPRYNTVHYYPL